MCVSDLAANRRGVAAPPAHDYRIAILQRIRLHAGSVAAEFRAQR